MNCCFRVVNDIVRLVFVIFSPLLMRDAVDSSGIAFFSKSRINSLTARLGHSRVKQLLNNLETMVQARVREPYDPADITIALPRFRTNDFKHSARSYTECNLSHALTPRLF